MFTKDILKLVNQFPEGEEVTPERIIQALENLKAKGYIDFEIFEGDKVKVIFKQEKLTYKYLTTTVH